MGPICGCYGPENDEIYLNVRDTRMYSGSDLYDFFSVATHTNVFYSYILTFRFFKEEINKRNTTRRGRTELTFFCTFYVLYIVCCIRYLLLNLFVTFTRRSRLDLKTVRPSCDAFVFFFSINRHVVYVVRLRRIMTILQIIM